METLYERRTHSEQSAVWIDPLQSLDDPHRKGIAVFIV